MKKLISLLTLIFTISIQAQNYRKIVPFQHQGKWGIVDSLNNETVKPQYKSVHVFNDFMYAEFDGKDLYNLKTGEKQKAIGKYINTLKIDGENYHVFSNTKNSFLVNFKKKDTVQLSEKYIRIENIQLYDLEKKKTTILVVGYIDYDTVMLLKNDKNLTPIINRKFNTEGVDTIENSNYKAIGLVFKEKGYYQFYNHQLKIIKKLKAPSNNIKHSELLDNDVTKKLPTIYATEIARSGCFSCESVWDDSWELNVLTDSPNESNYYITKQGREHVIKSTTDTNFTVEVYSTLFDYEQTYKMISIRNYNSESQFFYDARYIKTPHILYPEKYLKALKK